MNSRLESEDNEQNEVAFNESTSSSRESGECSPSPTQDSNGVDETEDVIFIATVSRNDKKCSAKPNGSLSATDLQISLTDNSLHECSLDLNTTNFSVDDSLFVLDTTPVEADDEIGSLSEVTLENGNSQEEKNGRHSRNKGKLDLSMVLTFASTAESPEPKRESLRKTTCFNCGGNHFLDLCDIPHDARRIAKNRMAHFNKRQPAVRYTNDVESSVFKPGVISRELRKALGIGFHDIPEWIYRMRKLGFVNGYPPAYLKQAIEGSDTLLEFHMEDSPSNQTSLHVKDSKPRINKDKIFCYPGFNTENKKLNDREKLSFQVPPFNAFVEYHQYALAERLREEAKKTQRSASKRQSKEVRETKCKKVKNGGGDSDDSVIEILDDDEDIALIPSSSATQSLLSKCAEMKNEYCQTPNAPLSNTVPRVQSSPALLGSSSSKCSGAPHGNIAVTFGSKPDLEKFRKGIVPFEAREDNTLQRGFFEKLMKLIKENGTTNHS